MGYRAFRDGTTFDDARESSEFTVEALDAHPDEAVRAQARGLQALLDQADALQAAYRKARRLVVRANARVRIADALADDELREFVKDLLGEVRQDRAAPLFQAFFPQAPTSVIELSLAPEVEELDRMLEVMAVKTTPAALRKAWEGRLKEVTRRGRSALADRKAATATLAEASDGVTRWIERADRARRAADGALTAHGANHDLPRDWNDRFFPGAPARRRAEKPPASPTPPPQ